MAAAHNSTCCLAPTWGGRWRTACPPPLLTRSAHSAIGRRSRTLERAQPPAPTNPCSKLCQWQDTRVGAWTRQQTLRPAPAQQPPAAPQQPGRQAAPPAPRRAPRGRHGGVSAASGAPAGDAAASAPARRGRTSSLIRRAGDSTCSNVANFWWWYSACARRLGVSLRTNGLTQLTVIYQSTQESARALGMAQPPGVDDPTAASPCVGAPACGRTRARPRRPGPPRR
jgi:hypothetical protein